MPETSGSTGRTPETHVIDFRAAEQLLAARDPRGAVKLLDGVIAAHPENTAARHVKRIVQIARRMPRRRVQSVEIVVLGFNVRIIVV